jgi:hypothetical protein
VSAGAIRTPGLERLGTAMAGDGDEDLDRSHGETPEELIAGALKAAR